MKASENFQQRLKFISLDRRLRFDHLSPSVRRYSVQVLGVGLFACLIIILSGLHVYPFETTIELPENLSPLHSSLFVPFSLLVILPAGLGLIAGAIFFASYQPGWRLPLLTRLTVGILALAFPLSFLQYSITIIGETGTGPGLIAVLIVFLAIFCGVATIICAFIRSTRIARWASRFATGSFLGLSLAFLMFKLWWDSLAYQIQINPAAIAIIHNPISTVISYLTPFWWLSGVIFFWKAIVEVKFFSREIGSKIANLSDRFPWLLAVLFGLKLAWSAIGYWGVIHGTATRPWEASGQDGPLAWLLAAFFAIATGWWLTHPRKQVNTESFSRATIFLTGGFLLLFIAAFLLFFPATLIVGLGLESIGLALGSISTTLAGLGISWTFLFAILLLPLGLVLSRWRKYRYLSPLFILCGLWSLPSIFQKLIPGLNISFEYLTFDTALTFTLFILAVLAWRGKQPRDNIWTISLVLVVSTLTALAESLIPEKLVYLGFAVLLVFPMLYKLLFDSSELNMPNGAGGQRLIQTVGFQAGLMLVVAWSLVLGLITPDQPRFEDVANKIFLPTILALYLTVQISDRKNLISAAPPVVQPQMKTAIIPPDRKARIAKPRWRPASIKVEGTVLINRPVRQVWKFLTNPENVAKWNSGILEVRQTSMGPVGPGSTLAAIEKSRGNRHPLTVKITEYDLNKKVGLNIASSLGCEKTIYTFESVTGRTRVLRTTELELKGIYQFLTPLLRRRLNPCEVERNMGELKRCVESL
jgi:hypothetical protein